MAHLEADELPKLYPMSKKDCIAAITNGMAFSKKDKPVPYQLSPSPRDRLVREFPNHNWLEHKISMLQSTQNTEVEQYSPIRKPVATNADLLLKSSLDKAKHTRLQLTSNNNAIDMLRGDVSKVMTDKRSQSSMTRRNNAQPFDSVKDTSHKIISTPPSPMESGGEGLVRPAVEYGNEDDTSEGVVDNRHDRCLHGDSSSKLKIVSVYSIDRTIFVDNKNDSGDEKFVVCTITDKTMDVSSENGDSDDEHNLVISEDLEEDGFTEEQENCDVSDESIHPPTASGGRDCRNITGDQQPVDRENSTMQCSVVLVRNDYLENNPVATSERPPVFGLKDVTTLDSIQRDNKQNQFSDETVRGVEHGDSYDIQGNDGYVVADTNHVAYDGNKKECSDERVESPKCLTDEGYDESEDCDHDSVFCVPVNETSSCNEVLDDGNISPDLNQRQMLSQSNIVETKPTNNLPLSSNNTRIESVPKSSVNTRPDSIPVISEYKMSDSAPVSAQNTKQAKLMRPASAPVTNSQLSTYPNRPQSATETFVYGYNTESSTSEQFNIADSHPSNEKAAQIVGGVREETPLALLALDLINRRKTASVTAAHTDDNTSCTPTANEGVNKVSEKSISNLREDDVVSTPFTSEVPPSTNTFPKTKYFSSESPLLKTKGRQVESPVDLTVNQKSPLPDTAESQRLAAEQKQPNNQMSAHTGPLHAVIDYSKNKLLSMTGTEQEVRPQRATPVQKNTSSEANVSQNEFGLMKGGKVVRKIPNPKTHGSQPSHLTERCMKRPTSTMAGFGEPMSKKMHYGYTQGTTVHQRPCHNNTYNHVTMTTSNDAANPSRPDLLPRNARPLNNEHNAQAIQDEFQRQYELMLMNQTGYRKELKSPNTEWTPYQAGVAKRARVVAGANEVAIKQHYNANHHASRAVPDEERLNAACKMLQNPLESSVRKQANCPSRLVAFDNNQSNQIVPYGAIANNSTQMHLGYNHVVQGTAPTSVTELGQPYAVARQQFQRYPRVETNSNLVNSRALNGAPLPKPTKPTFKMPSPPPAHSNAVRYQTFIPNGTEGAVENLSVNRQQPSQLKQLPAPLKTLPKPDNQKLPRSNSASAVERFKPSPPYEDSNRRVVMNPGNQHFQQRRNSEPPMSKAAYTSQPKQIYQGMQMSKTKESDDVYVIAENAYAVNENMRKAQQLFAQRNEKYSNLNTNSFSDQMIDAYVQQPPFSSTSVTVPHKYYGAMQQRDVNAISNSDMPPGLIQVKNPTHANNNNMVYNTQVAYQNQPERYVVPRQQSGLPAGLPCASLHNPNTVCYHCGYRDVTCNQVTRQISNAQVFQDCLPKMKNTIPNSGMFSDVYAPVVQNVPLNMDISRHKYELSKSLLNKQRMAILEQSRQCTKIGKAPFVPGNNNNNANIMQQQQQGMEQMVRPTHQWNQRSVAASQGMILNNYPMQGVHGANTARQTQGTGSGVGRCTVGTTGGVGRCTVCPGPASFLCARCKKTWYCTKRCQTEDWRMGHCNICTV